MQKSIEVRSVGGQIASKVFKKVREGVSRVVISTDRQKDGGCSSVAGLPTRVLFLRTLGECLVLVQRNSSGELQGNVNFSGDPVC